MVEIEAENRGKLVINVSELAKMLGISRGGAYQLTRQTTFPTLKINRRTLIPLAELRLWITQNSAKH
jgi:predicted DNA-binding transcriptional regulator AlpA